MPTIHTFDTTGAAYDACQTGQTNKGDILIVPDEGVIGVADTWPMAMTAARGELHGIRDGVTDEELADTTGIPVARFTMARDLAAQIEAAGIGFGTYVVGLDGKGHNACGNSPLHAIAWRLAQHPETATVAVRKYTAEDRRQAPAAEGVRFTTWSND